MVGRFYVVWNSWNIKFSLGRERYRRKSFFGRFFIVILRR